VIRAVLDANVLISGLISTKGTPGNILNAWLKEQFQLWISPQIYSELLRVFKYPRIAKRLERGQATKLLENLSALAEWAEGKLKLDILTLDPSDNIYLACAVEAHCDYLVTGDRDHFEEAGTEYRGVRIVIPRDFLDLLAAE
jgi:putative PIN family toxin of toxin-antitoxin system